jgi:hypothetical protein
MLQEFFVRKGILMMLHRLKLCVHTHTHTHTHTHLILLHRLKLWPLTDSDTGTD